MPPTSNSSGQAFSKRQAQYLVDHPDVNNFFNGLEGLTRDQAKPKVQAYMKTHPQTKTDLAGIRQPLMDIKNRCGNPGPSALELAAVRCGRYVR